METILWVAANRQVDLIVMGTRGRSRSAAIPFSSAVERTIIESRISVLAVKEFDARLGCWRPCWTGAFSARPQSSTDGGPRNCDDIIGEDMTKARDTTRMHDSTTAPTRDHAQPQEEQEAWHTYGVQYIFVIPSLAPPRWNKWSSWSGPHFQEVARAVSKAL